MAVKTYDPAQVAIVVNGFTMAGFADGTFVTVSRDEDAWALTIGTDGEGTRSKSNNLSGSVTLVLLSSSDSNAVLNALALSDELTNGGLFALLVKDNSGTSLHVAEQAWIQKLPDSEFAREATEREWVLRTDRLNMVVGGN